MIEHENKAIKYQEPKGLKLSVQIPPEATDEYLQFLQQMGIHYVYTWVDDHQSSYEFLSKLKERTERYGISIYNVGNMNLGKSESILLGMDDRDAHIERFAEFLRTLGTLGIHTTTVTWEPNNTLSTTPDGKVVSDRLGGHWANTYTRGGARARIVDMEVMKKAPHTHGREYSKEEIWNNFAYFVKNILPAAESAGVRIALHPNDPPVDSCLGIATLIQCCQDYEKAFEIADSDYLGMEFCVGCWLEGGKEFGDLMENIRRFVSRDKVFIVHFRNVNTTLPCFTETFVDDGYQDMYLVMKEFIRYGYNGTLTMDHTPLMVPSAGNIGETAYAVGYLKALHQAASDEIIK